MTSYKMQNLVYEWVYFSKFSQIWAKIGSNLRKFLKNLYGSTSVVQPALSVRRGKMKEPSRFLPFLPDFKKIFEKFVPDFLGGALFLAKFSLSGVAPCLLDPPSGYARHWSIFKFHSGTSLPKPNLSKRPQPK